jgi:hypothetical protein
VYTRTEECTSESRLKPRSKHFVERGTVNSVPLGRPRSPTLREYRQAYFISALHQRGFPILPILRLSTPRCREQVGKRTHASHTSFSKSSKQDVEQQPVHKQDILKSIRARSLRSGPTWDRTRMIRVRRGPSMSILELPTSAHDCARR